MSPPPLTSVRVSLSHVVAAQMSGLDYYRHSVFCLQPPGDMDGRKAIFDSISTGCIPVIFIPNLLHIKYPVMCDIVADVDGIRGAWCGSVAVVVMFQINNLLC